MRAPRLAFLGSVALAAVLTIAPATAAQADVPWTDPQRLSPQTGYADAPSLAIGSDRTTAAWLYNFGDELLVQVANTLDHGLTWTEPIEMASLASYPQNIQVDSADGLLIVSWIYAVGPDQVVQTSTSADGGATWGAAVTATPTPGAVAEQQVVGFGGALYLAWTYYDGTSSVKYVKSIDDGASWSAPTTISSPDSLEEPRLVSTGDALVLVARSNGAFNGIVSTSSTDGATWSALAELSPAGAYDSSPRVVVDGDSVYATWYGGQPGVVTVQVSRSDDDGLTWSEAVVVTGLGDSAYYPDIAAHDGAVALTWYEYEFETLSYRVRAATSTDDGATWSVSDYLSVEGYNGYNQRVVMNGSSISVIWERSTDAGLVIETSHNDGSGWSEPEVLSPPEFTEARYPTIVADNAAFIAAWRASDVDSAEVQAAARLFPVPPPAPTPAKPALAATGSTLASGGLLLALALLAVGVTAVAARTRSN